MRRREALKLGAGVAAGMALTGTGCALPGVRQEGDRLVPEDMDVFLKGWDDHLGLIAGSRFVEGFASRSLGKEVTPEMRRELEPSENLFRGMMHTMLLTQSFRDLSEEAQFHPEVQERMLRNAESVDSTVSAVADELEKMEPERRKSIQDSLRARPDLAMGMAEAMDAEAARAGITGRRRVQLRTMMTQASFRLSKNEPGVVIDECVGKVRRASDPGRAELLASQTAAQAGGEAFFRYRERLSREGAGTGGLAQGNRPFGPGGTAIRSGLWMMGIGVVTFGLSGIMVNAGAFPFVFGMTAGAVLFAVGLITTLVGAIIRLSKSKD